MLQAKGEHGSGDNNQQESNDQENELWIYMIFLLPGKPGIYRECNVAQKYYPDNNKNCCKWPVLNLKKHTCKKKCCTCPSYPVNLTFCLVIRIRQSVLHQGRDKKQYPGKCCQR